jgi:carbonic anhydrase
VLIGGRDHLFVAHRAARLDGPQARHDRLCELNVIEQVVNVCQTTVVRDAWDRGQQLSVHGWIYSLRNGRVRDLGLHVRAGTDTARAVADAYALISASTRE